MRKMRISFIGAAGIPNRYGGFESFLEHCAPDLATRVEAVTVTCERRLYQEEATTYRGVHRRFISVPANGGASMFHDLVAFLAVFSRSTHIVALGVSGGFWFPAFRLMCALSGKKLLVNIDGVEWRRLKFSRVKRLVLRVLDAAAQLSAHHIIYDNSALREFVMRGCLSKAIEIPYAGDHVARTDGTRESGSALTICRIEPENNVDMLIDGAMRSRLRRYTIVGNWANSAYGRSLRETWGAEPRLQLLDPIYDQRRLAQLRETCEYYLHGHSVGGTNPSLVEMLFYDCDILSFDCPFNRSTAGEAVRYFANAHALAALIDGGPAGPHASLSRLRDRYTRANIAKAYLRALER